MTTTTAALDRAGVQKVRREDEIERAVHQRL